MAEAPRSYYDVLGVPPEADARLIKDAYRRAARTAHPDLGGSAARFHDVSVAYEILGDPLRRERYDAESGRRPSSSAGAAPGRPGTVRAPRPARDRAGDAEVTKAPPTYLPPFSPSSPPAVPLILAGKQLHGSPRQPGVFGRFNAGVRARLAGELRTAALLERTLLPTYPAARLVNGIEFDDREDTAAGHVLLAGYRMAVIDSFTAPSGTFSWDGRSLRHQGRAVEYRTDVTVRYVQELFPECTVSGWIVIHGAPDNPFAPVIDVPSGFDRSAPGPVQVVNPGTAVRTLRSFLASGPSPSAVRLPVLARLLAAAGS